MQALILVGGEGTRLRPLTLTAPKPVLPLVDRPLIRYMIDWLARHGVDEVILACGFLPDGIRAVLGDQVPGGPRLRYVVEPEPRGTAGAIKFAAELLDDRFLALNGDVLTDLDLTALIELHEQRGAGATLALHPVDDPTAYGLVRRDPDGAIREFLEKPDPAEIDTDEISAGAYVLEKEVLDLVPADREVSIEREVFPRLVGNGLYARRLEGYWMDIGTPERYLQACWDILGRAVETEPGAKVGPKGVWVSPRAEVSEGATVSGPAFIEEGGAIDPDAKIGPRAVIGPGCRVGVGARVEGSAIHPGCVIGAGATVSGSIVGPRVRIESGAMIGDGAMIGEGAHVGASATVEPGARVQPEEELG